MGRPRGFRGADLFRLFPAGGGGGVVVVAG